MEGPAITDVTSGRERRLAPSVLAGVGTLVAVVLVAVLAAGSSDGGSRLSSRPIDPRTVLDVLFAVMLAYAVVVTVVLVVAVARSGRGDGRTSPGPRWLAMIQGMALMGLVMWLWLSRRPDREPVELEPVEFVFDSTTVPDGPTGVEPGSSPGWVWMLALALILAAAGVAWWTTHRLRGTAPLVPGADEDAERLHAVGDLFDSTIDDLRDHPDPRAAVIAAFARLQAGLTGLGVPRERADTPSRYLRRVLDHVEVSGPAAARLTQAYELAHYSHHEVGRADQLAAVDALVAVRDELRATARRRRSFSGAERP
jgi:phosphatidylglycerophosphate synthase